MRILSIYFLVLGLMGSAFAEDMDLKKYPKAEKGQVMQVIVLPKLENEGEKKVQILVGKFAMVDSANMARMMGEMKAVDLKGWGYQYYVFTSDGNIMQTRRGGGKLEKRFVDALSDFSVRYNSKLPIVVYVPKGFSVKYRIWTLGEEELHAVPVEQ